MIVPIKEQIQERSFQIKVERLVIFFQKPKATRFRWHGIVRKGTWITGWARVRKASFKNETEVGNAVSNNLTTSKYQTQLNSNSALKLQIMVRIQLVWTRRAWFFGSNAWLSALCNGT